jgi:hypothetical protein
MTTNNDSKAADAEQTLTLAPCNSNAASFFNSKDLSDCEVVIAADGRTVSSHKFALSAASAVFRAMFVSSDMLEANSGKVVVKDAEPAVVELLLRHMYGVEVQVPMQQVRCCYRCYSCYCCVCSTATQQCQMKMHSSLHSNPARSSIRKPYNGGRRKDPAAALSCAVIA